MSEETRLSSTINKHNAGARLIDFLSARFRYHTREEWEGLILKGSVTVNGLQASSFYLLEKNDKVAYTVILREPPVDANIRIIHNEEAFLVAFKPGGLPSHADGNFIKNTFIFLIKKTIGDEGGLSRVKLVHRLDRETSGLMIVAKKDAANRSLGRQFEKGTVEKEYIAVTRGIFKDDSTLVNAAIGPDHESRISIRKRVTPEGAPGSQPAVTGFEVIERLAGYTVVRCVPKTGRTSQIRVHLAHLGHPLAGDKLYGRSDSEFLEFVRRAREGLHDPLPWMEAPRHMLHASMIAFQHPVTGERMSFRCPMPEDMLSFIEKARQSRR